jgi:hypothetical protein
LLEILTGCLKYHYKTIAVVQLNTLWFKKKSVGHFTHRVGCRRRSLVAKQHEILLIFFLDCKVDRPVVKSLKVLANLMKNNFLTRVCIFDANLMRHPLHIIFNYCFACKFIGQFDNIIRTIQSELGVVEFDMIYLICDDLKNGLIRTAREHIEKLVMVLIKKHQEECR